MSSSLLASAAASALLSLAAAQPPAASSVITVDWAAVQRPLQTIVGFQTVVNPVTCRESPYHDQVYQKIADLGAPYQRYVPWLPYPKLGVAELEPPSTGSLCGFVNSGNAAGIWSVTLDCGAQGAGNIDGVVFANYGQPTGFCNGLKASASCTKDVSSVVAAACVGKSSCTMVSNDATFGAAPCAGARLAVEVTCSNKAVKTFTYWDFKYPDEGMLDFLAAADSGTRTSIPNFSTIPQWMWVGKGDRSYYPDDPLGEVWDYEQGGALVDPSGAQVGDYYGRLLAHYIEGGFLDEAGRFIPGYNLSFSHWEGEYSTQSSRGDASRSAHPSPAFATRPDHPPRPPPKQCSTSSSTASRRSSTRCSTTPSCRASRSGARTAPRTSSSWASRSAASTFPTSPTS